MYSTYCVRRVICVCKCLDKTTKSVVTCIHMRNN